MATAVAAPRKTPQTLLVDWANAQDAWVRFLVGEALATRQPLGETQLASAYDCLLIEKNLEVGTVPMVAMLKDSGNAGERVQKLQLVKLSDVDGVNALRGGQEVTFSPRLTVLFGENAAGKSGYVRVLKRLAAVRSHEEVLPNLLGAARPRRASVTYVLDGKEDEHQWTGEAGVSPFTRMSGFDTKAVAVHLDEDLTYTYTPRDLALFRISHEAIDAVKQKLEVERKKAVPQGNPFTSLFLRGTRVYAKVETLGPQSDLDDLKKLAAVTDAEVEEVPDLRDKVDALKSQSGELRLQAAKSDLELLKRLSTVSTALDGIDWKAYAGLVDAVAVARAKHEDATVNAFTGLAIPSILSTEWRRFVEAGEAYLRTASSVQYPAEGDPCTYCRQPLEAAAVALIHKYRDFTNNLLKQEATKAETALTSFSQSIGKLAIDSVRSDVQQRVEAMSNSMVPAVLAQARELLLLAVSIQEKVGRGERVADGESGSVSERAKALALLSRAGIKQAEELVAALTSEAGERETLLADLSSQLAEREARIKLSDLISGISDHVEKAKWAPVLG